MTAERSILHVDMDAFFASIEQLDDPALRGRPVLVGGAGPRGVVAAASYEARRFGCRSAQPMSVALRGCPQAVVVAPRGARYREISRAVFDCLEQFTPLVEPLSVDEAFLDVTGTERLHGSPAECAAAIRQAIRADTGLTASVGVASNKFLAKLASDLDKPDGLVVVEGDAAAFLAPMPVSRMWGVGPATERKLAASGVRTFGDLQGIPPVELTRQFGAWGERLAALSRGDDHRPVVRSRSARSISHEHTFGVDEAAPEVVRRLLQRQMDDVCRRLRRQGMLARCVTVKIRYGDFQTITRSATVDEPTDRTDVLSSTAATLFDSWVRSSFRPVRLIGGGASQLVAPAEVPRLFADPDDDRFRQLDRVTDAIRDRFGRDSIGRGPGV